MNTEWMGRYRQLVSALVLHSNVVSKGLSEKTDIGDGVLLSPQEWETLEYIIEHQGRYFCMADISSSLGIPQSSFSRIVQYLKSQKLIERFQLVGNRKTVILRPSAYALELYARQNNTRDQILFNQFFKDLEPLSDEDLALFTNALNRFTRSLPSANYSQKVELVKID